MANPRGRKHRFNARGPKRAGRPRRPRKQRKARRTKKAAKAGSPEKKDAPEGCEAVKHYGDAWDYEHYEKESLKALGLFL